jgi:DNA-directed RNA polymerase specialized sigma24 family protein
MMYTGEQTTYHARDRAGRISFPLTEWSVVSAAGGLESPQRQIALDTVLVRYLPVLQSYVIRHFRVDPERANDWLQAFILDKVLEKDLLSHADPARVKFRSFLLKTLTNYIVQQLRKELCRGGGPGVSMSLDNLPPHAELPAPPVLEEFDLSWARQVMGEALRRMQRDCLTGGRQAHWCVFVGRLLQPLTQGGEAAPYETLVRQLGLASVGDASTLLLSAKRTFSRHFRSVVAEYVDEDSLVESEIRSIKQLIFEHGMALDLRLFPLPPVSSGGSDEASEDLPAFSSASSRWGSSPDSELLAKAC